MTTWQSVKVSDLGRIVTGKTPKTAVSENYGGDIPFLTPSDDISVKYVNSTAKTLTERGVAEVKNALIPPDSVCVSCIGSDLGKVVITTERTVTNQQINSIVVNKELFDVSFIYYAMLILGKELNFISKTSTAVPIVNKSAFSSYGILCPSLEQQKEIAAILSAFDSKIECNKKINDNLQQQAQAIYHSLFVSFDGISANQLYETELGLIPAGWTVKPLSEVTTSIRAKVKANDYKVLSAINTGQLQLSEEYFNKQVFSKNISNYIVVEPYDFAYNPARINIGSIGMNNFGFTGCVSPVYVVVRTEPNYHYFLDFFVKTKRFSEEVKTRSSGSVRQSLSYADFGQIKIAYPPAEVVEQFNCEYVARLKIIEHLKAENEKLASLRDSLLPKLMSGEIDVSDIQL